MKYCTNCGCELSKGVKFCENCGTKLVDYDEDSKKTVNNFSKSISKSDGFYDYTLLNGVYENAWREAANETIRQGKELGIILTRMEELSSNLSCSVESLANNLEEYIVSTSQRGVNYFLFDEEDDDIEDIIAHLDLIISVARPKYLLILGNEKIIPVGVWDNRCYSPFGDTDEQVFSDIPYGLLDGTSPWEGQKFNLTEMMRVGRVPNYDGEKLSDYWKYFENVETNAEKIDEIIPFGYSTLSWRGLSTVVYNNYGKHYLFTSPNHDKDTISYDLKGNENFFYFNLHGGNEDFNPDWFGEGSGGMLSAFHPKLFDGYQTPFFLGVEACYGARYMDGLTKDNSILLTALQNKCLSFLGSTTIAYGIPFPCKDSPDGTCADIVIGEYLKGLQKGETAGDAYVEALKILTSKTPLKDSSIKTFAQFALYGDPSVSMGPNKNVGKIKSFMKGITGAPKGIKINLPDVRKAVRLVEASVNERINQIVDDYVFENCFSKTAMKGLGSGEIHQSVSKLTNSNLYVKTYSKQTEKFNQIVKAYFTEDGEIESLLVSK